MTRKEFIDQLTFALNEMPEEDRTSVISYYEEMIDDRVEAGMTEESAVNAMEPVEEIAGRVIEERQAQNRRDGAPQTGDKEIRRSLDEIYQLNIIAAGQNVIVKSGEQSELIMRYHIDSGDIYRLHEENGVLTLEHKRRPVHWFSGFCREMDWKPGSGKYCWSRVEDKNHRDRSSNAFSWRYAYRYQQQRHQGRKHQPSGRITA